MILNEAKAAGVEVFFIESLCNDPDVIMTNIKEVKLSSPDYRGKNTDDVVGDFLERIKHYEGKISFLPHEPLMNEKLFNLNFNVAPANYETLDDSDGSYIKLVDVGSECIINQVKGFLQSKICHYLMNLHIKPRSIYLTRVRTLLPLWTLFCFVSIFLR